MKFLFNRTRLKPYLLTIFGINIALACCLSFLGTTGLRTTQKASKAFVTEAIVTDSAIKACEVEMNRAGLDQREIVLSYDEDIPALKERLSTSIAIVKEQLPVLKSSATFESAENQELITQYE